MGGNAYEEARNLNILQNRKKLQEFGLPKILADAQAEAHLNNSQKKPKQSTPKPKPKDIQPRRSSRPRNTVSYRDDLDIDLPPLRKRSRTNSSSRGSSNESLASYEERARAIKAAEELQSSLQSQCPSFVKSMVRSHVYSCFWLGLPTEFCKTHLSTKSIVEMVLEDENGKEYAATYIGKRVGLSGGWRAFALEHELDDGDALVFELVEPSRFKIYITRLSSISCQEHNAKVLSEEVTGAKKTSNGAVNSQSYQTRKSKKANLCESDDLSSPQEPQPQNGVASEGPSEVVEQSKKNGFISQKVQKKGKLPNAGKSQEPQPQKGVAGEGTSEVSEQCKKNGFISQKVQKNGKLPNAGKSQEPQPQNGVASEGPSAVVAGKSKEVESTDKCVSHKPRNRKERLFRKTAW